MNVKKMLCAAGGAMLTAALVLGGVAPANAAMSDCGTGTLCTWGDADFKTDGTDSARQYFYQYISNYNHYNYIGKSINAGNSATSIYNNGVSETAFMYANPNKSGFLFSIPRGNSNWNLWWQGSQNDNIESGYYASFN